MPHSLRLGTPPFDRRGVLCASGIGCRSSYNWRIGRCPELVEVFRIMGTTLCESDSRACIDDRAARGGSALHQFMEVSICPKLAVIAKSYNRAWSAGYCSSNIAESMNTSEASNFASQSNSCRLPYSPICGVLRVNGGPDEVKSHVHDRWKIGDAHSREEASKLPASIAEDPDPRVRSATMGPPNSINVSQVARFPMCSSRSDFIDWGSSDAGTHELATNADISQHRTASE
jgi:hypothetical protein